MTSKNKDKEDYENNDKNIILVKKEYKKVKKIIKFFKKAKYELYIYIMSYQDYIKFNFKFH